MERANDKYRNVCLYCKGSTHLHKIKFDSENLDADLDSYWYDKIIFSLLSSKFTYSPYYMDYSLYYCTDCKGGYVIVKSFIPQEMDYVKLLRPCILKTNSPSENIYLFLYK
jgi:hypothetical protein